MQLTTLALLLAAAFLHATCNALMKSAKDKLAFSWWMLGVSSVFGSPLLTVGLPQDTTGWTLVIISGLLEAVYFVTLSVAYTHGDLSQVYPIARGSAPLFILAWAGLFLSERPSSAGMCGVLMIVLGLYLINLPSLGDWKRPFLGFKQPAAQWALVTGVLISAYATIDKVGVKHVEPAAYVILILAVAWLALAGQWLIPNRRLALMTEISGLSMKDAIYTRLRIALCAAFGVTAYLLVLLALQISPVGYIGAVREISVVIGAWMGIKFFREKGGPVRIISSILVVLGIFLIAWAG